MGVCGIYLGAVNRAGPGGDQLLGRSAWVRGRAGRGEQWWLLIAADWRGLTSGSAGAQQLAEQITAEGAHLLVAPVALPVRDRAGRTGANPDEVAITPAGRGGVDDEPIRWAR
jgi:hypothetical protein